MGAGVNYYLNLILNLLFSIHYCVLVLKLSSNNEVNFMSSLFASASACRKIRFILSRLNCSSFSLSVSVCKRKRKRQLIPFRRAMCILLPHWWEISRLGASFYCYIQRHEYVLEEILVRYSDLARTSMIFEHRCIRQEIHNLSYHSTEFVQSLFLSLDLAFVSSFSYFMYTRQLFMNLSTKNGIAGARRACDCAAS